MRSRALLSQAIWLSSNSSWIDLRGSRSVVARHVRLSEDAGVIRQAAGVRQRSAGGSGFRARLGQLMDPWLAPEPWT